MMSTISVRAQRMWVLKKQTQVEWLWSCLRKSLLRGFLDQGLVATGGPGARLTNRTKRLIFCAAAARKNCSRTNLIQRVQATQADQLILQFCKQRLYLSSCGCEWAKAGVLTRSRARCWAGSWMWMARYLYWPVMHCAFCSGSAHIE